MGSINVILPKILVVFRLGMLYNSYIGRLRPSRARRYGKKGGIGYGNDR